MWCIGHIAYTCTYICGLLGILPIHVLIYVVYWAYCLYMYVYMWWSLKLITFVLWIYWLFSSTIIIIFILYFYYIFIIVTDNTIHISKIHFLLTNYKHTQPTLGLSVTFVFNIEYIYIYLIKRTYIHVLQNK